MSSPSDRPASTVASRRCSSGSELASLKAATTTVSLACVMSPSYRGSGSLQLLQPGLAAEVAHVALDPLRPALHIRPRAVRAVAARAGQHRGQARALAVRQRGRVLAPVAARRRLRPVDAVAELGHVDVDLEDALLRPQQFDPQRVPGLGTLAQPAAAAPEEQVLGQLLADRAAAAHAPAIGV